MEIRDYLRQARSLDRHIDSRLEQAARLRSLAERVTTVFSPLPKGSPGNNRQEDCIIRLVDLEREVSVEITRLVEMKRRVRGLVARLGNDKQRSVLEYYYLSGLTWEAVAERMDCDPRNVHYLHNRALKALEAQDERAGA